MKENVLDVLMYLFENYFYDEPEEEPDRISMEQNLEQAGFSNGEIDKAFKWLDGLAEQRYQPEFKVNTEQPIRIFVDSETDRMDTNCRDFLLYLSNVGILDAQKARTGLPLISMPEITSNLTRLDGSALTLNGPQEHTRQGGRGTRFIMRDMAICLAEDFIPGLRVELDGDLIPHGP